MLLLFPAIPRSVRLTSPSLSLPLLPSTPSSSSSSPHPPHLSPAQEFTSKDIRWKAEALLAMQEAAEYYLVGLFEDA